METSAMSTSRPLVERSRTDGIEMPARWSHAPSSKGTGSPGGRPAGSGILVPPIRGSMPERAAILHRIDKEGRAFLFSAALRRAPTDRLFDLIAPAPVP